MIKNNQLEYKSIEDLKPFFKKMMDIVAERMKKEPRLTLLWLLILGILNRTYELTETITWSIKNKRPQTTALCLRSLYETLSFIYYWQQKIEQSSDNKKNVIIENALLAGRKENYRYKSINILTCIDKAKESFLNIRKNYDEISELVHPNVASHFYTMEINEKNKTGSCVFPFYKFKFNDKKNSLNQTGECCEHIINICEDLVKISYYDYD